MKTKETSNKPFKRGIVELSSGKKEVNYRFINESEIEMYDDSFSFIGITHYKSLVVDEVKSTREQAIAWWNNLRKEKGVEISWKLRDKYFPDRSIRDLTGSEIEEIWKRETKHSIYNNSQFQIGDKVIVFDSQTWKQTGDVGDNSQFYKSAIVTGFGQDHLQRWIVDVKFEDGRILRGHFQSEIVKDYSKSNQKQFKKFDKDLFKSYIEKFSYEDRIKALQILFFSCSKPANMTLVNEIIDYCK